MRTTDRRDKKGKRLEYGSTVLVKTKNERGRVRYVKGEILSFGRKYVRVFLEVPGRIIFIEPSEVERV